MILINQVSIRTLLTLNTSFCTGAIGIDELEQPLISYGICHNRHQVEMIMKDIDLDGNGELEFDEFLCMIKTAQRGEKENKKVEKPKLHRKLTKS